MDMKQLKDSLLEACIGLARTLDNKHLEPDAETTTVMLYSLYMADNTSLFSETDIRQQIKVLHKKKADLSPACLQCGHPCGEHDDPDLTCVMSGEDAPARQSLLDKCIKIGATLGSCIKPEQPEINAPLYMASSQIISFIYDSLCLSCSMKKPEEWISEQK